MAVVILLPFVGFYLGMMYQRMSVPTENTSTIPEDISIDECLDRVAAKSKYSASSTERAAEEAICYNSPLSNPNIQ